MLDSWCSQRETEANNSCRSRIYAVVSFVRYLQKRGLTDVKTPAIPRKEARTYIPHAFSEIELHNFFDACDSITSYSETEEQISQKLTVPVFFRLLYSSGIRTNEARMLRKNDVDLIHGVLNIAYSKGHDQHFIVMHDSMLELMREYDMVIAKMYPKRLYFFPARNGKCHTKQWVAVNFKKMWEKRNSSSAVPYEFRHNYAIENINSWTDDGFDFHQKLHSLSKSMGHSVIESTKYYYSLVPRLADVLAEHTNEDETIPEVRYESY
ncbi:MAG: tyrosine-type recombinase/integrase [Clostridiales Family XIII bacterium]|jgi:site-specific recombinase XerD|nr:tyrosine-type recombinase/integrase [Clostridiales Family XIII bacterium]